MTTNILYRGDGIEATYDQDKRVLFAGFSKCPSSAEIDKMWVVVSTFLENQNVKNVLHLAHVDSDALEPPELATLVHLATKVCTNSKNLAQKCDVIIIQPKFIDGKVLLAQQMFKGLVTNDIDIQILDSGEKVNKCIEKCTGRSAKKK